MLKTVRNVSNFQTSDIKRRTAEFIVKIVRFSYDIESFIKFYFRIEVGNTTKDFFNSKS